MEPAHGPAATAAPRPEDQAPGSPVTSLTVNGQSVTVTVPADTPLVSVLRWDLGLRGVRAGCAIGSCGACTVLLDGAPIRSCITPLAAAAGRALLTPEGLGTPARPGPVQQVFLDERAAQCGYCVNGITMSLSALAGRELDEEQLRVALSGHLCRCGTHVRLLCAARRVLAADFDGQRDVRAAPPAMPPSPATVPTAPGPDAHADALPSGGAADDRVQARLALRPDGLIAMRPGKVELGQGIVGALAQIAASQIGVPVERIAAVSLSTAWSPDEGNTSGSRSIAEAGQAMARAGRAFRRLLLERAAEMHGTPGDATGPGPEAAGLMVEAEGVSSPAGGLVTFAQLAARGPLTGTVAEGDVPDWSAPLLGSSAPRADLLPKVTGSPAFVQDLSLPGMAHARALLPPSLGAHLEGFDAAAARALPGVLALVHDGDLLIVVAVREEQAVAAAQQLRVSSTWSPGPGLPGEDMFAVLRALPAETHVARAAPAPTGDGRRRMSATYTQPYTAHGPVAPACAVAHVTDQGLRVWTSAQGPFPLRRELARLLSVAVEAIEVVSVDGPGCYGHTPADDAAAFAAIAARAVPGTPVRFALSVHDEFAWDPRGPAMLADLSAELDGDGAVRRWEHRTRTDTHNSRPGGSGTELMAAWLGSGRRRPLPRGADGAGARNTVPLYDFPEIYALTEQVSVAVRTGTLRAPGAYLNTFAAESFLDELSRRAGADPLAYRLAHLGDPRARRVLQAAAEALGWEPRPGSHGRGQGLALCRYKSDKAYVAQAVALEVDVDSGRLRIERIVTVCDAGTVIDRDGLVNQLEGSTLHALSRALFEQLPFVPTGTHATDWTSYPVLTFADVPPVEVVVLEAVAGSPPLGVGEAAVPPLPAAIANAVEDACGLRLRDLPFTPERIRAAARGSAQGA